jgi:hypothetical protein
MFIDRLQIHSMLEDWSIDACECSGETIKVEKRSNFKIGQSSQPRLYRCLQA